MNPSVSTMPPQQLGGANVDASQTVPITFAHTSTYAHTILNFNGTSILPQPLVNFHQLSQVEFTKTCQEVDTLILKDYAYEERKQLILTICTILSIGLLPLVGFLVYFCIDELFLKRKRDFELREKVQQLLDDHNSKIYNSKGVSLVLDVALALNVYNVPIESWEIKVISHSVQLPPNNQPLASPVKLFETRSTYNRNCRFFNPNLPSSLKNQYTLSDEWKNLVDKLNSECQNDLDQFYNYIIAPMYWSLLVSTPTLAILFLLVLPFLAIYAVVIYFVKLNPESNQMRKERIPAIIKEANEKIFLPKGLRVGLLQNDVKRSHVDTLYLIKQ